MLGHLVQWDRDCYTISGRSTSILSFGSVHVPETRQTNGKVACRNVVLDIACFGAENGVCCHHAQLREHDGRHSPLVAIRDHREAISRDGAHSVARDGEQLRVRRGVSHVLDDLRHRELQAIVRSDVGPEHEDQKIDLPVTNNGPKYTPVEGLLFLSVFGPDTPSCNLAELEVTDLVW